MRLAKISRTFLILALPPVLATCALAQANVNPNAVRNQLMKAAPGQSQPQTAPQAPVSKPARTPAQAPSTFAPGKSAKTSAEKPAQEKATTRRDPFETLLSKARSGDAPPENLPPGKAGLIVGTLRINGIV